jgi:hypothetical protein
MLGNVHYRNVFNSGEGLFCYRQYPRFKRRTFIVKTRTMTGLKMKYKIITK